MPYPPVPPQWEHSNFSTNWSYSLSRQRAAVKSSPCLRYTNEQNGLQERAIQWKVNGVSYILV